MPSLQKKNDKDVMSDLFDILTRKHPQHELVFILLRRNVYCELYLISRQAVKY